SNTPTSSPSAAPWKAAERWRLRRLERLDDGGVALAAAAAEGSSAGAAAAAAQLVDEGEQHTVAGHADGVAEGDGAAVDVDDVVADAEVVHRRQTHGGKGLVQLEEVDVLHVLVDLGQGGLDRTRRLVQERRVGSRDLAIRDELGERRGAP